MSNRLADESVAAFVNALGRDPTSRMLQSDVNRDVLPGSKTPGVEEMSPEDRARADRYAWGEQAGLGGLPTALYSELVKVPAVRTPMRAVTGVIGKLAGYPQAQDWYDQSKESSPASWENVRQYVRGTQDPTAGGTLPALFEMLARRR